METDRMIHRSVIEILKQNHFTGNEQLQRELLLAAGCYPGGKTDPGGLAERGTKADIARAWENVMRRHGIFTAGNFRYQALRIMEMNAVPEMQKTEN